MNIISFTDGMTADAATKYAPSAN